MLAVFTAGFDKEREVIDQRCIPENVRQGPRMRHSDELVHDVLIGRGWVFVGYTVTCNVYRSPDLQNRELWIYTNRVRVGDFILPVEARDFGAIQAALLHQFHTSPHHLLPHILAPDEETSRLWAHLGDEFPAEQALLVKGLARPLFKYNVTRPPGTEKTSGKVVLNVLGGPEPSEDQLARVIPGVIDRVRAARHAVGVFRTLNVHLLEDARNRGEDELILITNAEFEFGRDGSGNELRLVDDSLTLNATSCMMLGDWVAIAGIGSRLEPQYRESFHTAELVRYLRRIDTPYGTGLHCLDPHNEDHRNFVHSLEIPSHLIEGGNGYEGVEALAHQLFIRIAGEPLECYQLEQRGIQGMPDPHGLCEPHPEYG
jgi:hypothetical protein